MNTKEVTIVLTLLLLALSSLVILPAPVDGAGPAGARAESVLGEGYQHRFRGDLANTGVSLSASAPEGNRTVWKFQAEEDIYSSAIVAEGRLYFGAWDKLLHCLDALTGRELWTFYTEDRIYSTPTFWNGIVYIGTGTEGGSKIARLYAVNASTGEQVWSFKAGKNFVGGAAVVDGILYAGSLDGTLYALDAAGSGDGTTSVYWRFVTDGEIWSTPAVYNNSIYITSSDCRVYRVNLADGKELWRYQTEYTLDGMWSSVTIGEGKAFFGSGFNPLGKLYALDADTGAHIWNFSTGESRYGIGASPGYHDGIVYVGANNGRVYAFNATAGTELWNYSTGDDYNGIYSSPAIADGKLYIGSSDNYLYCLDAKTGAEVWKHRSGGFGEYGLVASPTIVSGRMYVGFTGDDIMYCFGDTVIPELSLGLEIRPGSGDPRTQVYAEETVTLVLSAVERGEGSVMSGVDLQIDVDGGELRQDSGVTDPNGEFSVAFTAPTVTSSSEVVLSVKAEAVGHLTAKEEFVIPVVLNPALTYELDPALADPFAYTSLSSYMTVLDNGEPAGNVTVELRVTDGAVRPVSIATNESGKVYVTFTAPGPGENNTLRNVRIHIRLVKPGYETGRYTLDIKVIPPTPPQDGDEEDGLDLVTAGLTVIIIMLVIVIILGLTLRGKKYW